MSVLDLARSDIRGLAPYSSARMEAGLAAVMLNANENPWAGDSGEVSDGLNRYPDPQPNALLESLAALYGVAPAQVLVGRGSDEPIDLLTRAFCRAGQDAILISPPTFGMYAVAARIQGAAVQTLALDEANEFQLDAAALLAAVTPATRLVYVCTPNNPTGAVTALAIVAEIARALTARAVLVVDEAYAEFTDAPSAATLLPQHDNLVVLRTLSKAYALAAARIGTLLAAPEIIQLLRRILPPYPLPQPCVAAALACLAPANAPRVAQRIALLRAERTRVAAALAKLACVQRIWPSQANFVCARFRDAESVYAHLAREGIVVRNVGHYPGLAKCLRLTVGTPAENDAVLAALASVGATA